MHTSWITTPEYLQSPESRGTHSSCKRAFIWKGIIWKWITQELSFPFSWNPQPVFHLVIWLIFLICSPEFMDWREYLLWLFQSMWMLDKSSEDSHKFNLLKKKCTSKATVTWKEPKYSIYELWKLIFVGFLNIGKAKVCLQRNWLNFSTFPLVMRITA